MSIKGRNSDWYVGKKSSNLITWNGKKIFIDYEELSQIIYNFASTTSIGTVTFIKRTDDKLIFNFSKKSNSLVLRAIDLIKENNPELVLEKETEQNPRKQAPQKKNMGLSFILLACAVFAIIFIVNETNSNRVVPTNKLNVNEPKTNINVKKADVSSNETALEEETNLFNVGDVFDSDKLKIMYLDCGDYESDNEFIQPASGNKFIYVEFSIENVSDSDRSVGFLDFDCYADDTECTYAITTIEDAMTSITTLSPNRYAKGKICYEVPQNASNIEIEFETSFWTQDKIYFIVK